MQVTIRPTKRGLQHRMHAVQRQRRVNSNETSRPRLRGFQAHPDFKIHTRQSTVCAPPSAAATDHTPQATHHQQRPHPAHYEQNTTENTRLIAIKRRCQDVFIFDSPYLKGDPMRLLPALATAVLAFSDRNSVVE